MDIIEELQNYKRNLGFSNEAIAKGSGVPLATVQKIFGGITRSPRRDTLLKLESFFRNSYRYDNEHSPVYSSDGQKGFVNESPVGYGEKAAGPGDENDIGWIIKPRHDIDYTKEHDESDEYRLLFTRQGTYTLDDYYALPDGVRCELIDGVMYEFNAPTLVHQSIISDISAQMSICADDHDCKLSFSPVNIQLDCDDKTMVQPDIAVLCDRSKAFDIRCIYGAPDFVVEVLSTSTRKRDLTVKPYKYEHAGCREYWIVDPDTESVFVYFFEDNSMIYHYTFSDKVPVMISGGTCEVDFSRIRDSLSWFQK